MEISPCKICGTNVTHGIFLTDGESIHEPCLESLRRESSGIERQIDNCLARLTILRKELSRESNVLFRLTTVFRKKSKSIHDLETEIDTIESARVELADRLGALHASLRRIYDLLPNYPPDWEERKLLVGQRDGYQCNKCGGTNTLHLHHIIPLSQGGNNKIDNLEYQCVKCHSKSHGGRIFDFENKQTDVVFSRRLEKIYYAIANDCRITFKYKKYKAKSYGKRTVRPEDVVKIEHWTDEDYTVCVRGYCELREAERNFAIKRMRDLKILE